MEIGKKIKTLRLAKGVTQEMLAREVNVTPQAVSRWENGQALPDITLLPALSVYFGVRIDDFFALSDSARLDRIDNMIETQDFLSRADFDDAQRFLKDRLATDPNDARSCRVLAGLYKHRAEGYNRLAVSLAKRSLALEPEVKDGHSILSFAAHGACWDWCSSNHRELIDYYYDFIGKNPAYLPGYLWLLDNLIADGRLDEAEKAVEDMAALGYSYHVPLYAGHVAARRGHVEKAEELWRQMVEREPERWIVWSCMGDALVKQCRYDEALACFEKASTLQSAPRMIDDYDSIGQICEMQGKWQAAAAAYEQVLAVYRDDWQITEGYWVEKYQSAVLRCRAKG